LSLRLSNTAVDTPSFHTIAECRDVGRNANHRVKELRELGYINRLGVSGKNDVLIMHLHPCRQEIASGINETNRIDDRHGWTIHLRAIDTKLLGKLARLAAIEKHRARNSRRYGLSLSIFADPALSEQVEAFAREIAGDTSDDDIYQLARRVAAAQIDLQRMRNARHQLLCDELADPYYEPRADTRAKMKVIKQLLTPKPADVPLPAFIEKYLTTTPEGPAKLAAILSGETKQLAAMDRYERRALSRHKPLYTL